MITPETTAVLIYATPASAGPNIYTSCLPLMESAKAHGIRLRWLALREGYSGPLYERCRRFLDDHERLHQLGMTHAFVLESPLITFRRSLADMCGMVKDYEPGTLYVEPVTKVSSSYNNPAFLRTLEEEGVPHDSRVLFGHIDAIHNVCQIVLDLSREFLSNTPAMGVATECMLDKKGFAADVGRYAEDVDFLMHLASIYHPGLFKLRPMFLSDSPVTQG